MLIRYIPKEIKYFQKIRGSNKAGIYLWTNLINKKRYVGSSADLSRRFPFFLFLPGVGPQVQKKRKGGGLGFVEKELYLFFLFFSSAPQLGKEGMLLSSFTPPCYARGGQEEDAYRRQKIKKKTGTLQLGIKLCVNTKKKDSSQEIKYIGFLTLLYAGTTSIFSFKYSILNDQRGQRSKLPQRSKGPSYSMCRILSQASIDFFHHQGAESLKKGGEALPLQLCCPPFLSPGASGATKK